ncbi:MAG: hypothetical protein MJ200_02140 [Mycoplasmoidaceae bacterium]|nr:hypothetical protein [Mycoplasmoidaceae bacterium]
MNLPISSSQLANSIFSEPISCRIGLILSALAPIQAPIASIPGWLDLTATFVLYPATLPTFLISTTPV